MHPQKVGILETMITLLTESRNRHTITRMTTRRFLHEIHELYQTRLSSTLRNAISAMAYQRRWAGNGNPTIIR